MTATSISPTHSPHKRFLHDADSSQDKPLAGQGRNDLDALVPMVYQRLKSLARSRINRAVGGESLQATGLVHEVYLRLARENGPQWHDSAHFFAVAVQAMRWIMIDRTRQRARRPTPVSQGSVDQLAEAAREPPWDHEALEAALQELERQQPRKAQVVMLRYLAGLSVEDTAAALGISTATVKREWRFARAWLCHRVLDASREEAQ